MKWLILFASCLSCFAQDATLGLAIRTLGSSANTGNDASEATASYNPQIGSELVAIVINTKASAPDVPTLTGNSLSWTKLFDTNYLTDHKLTIWYAKCGSGVTPGALTAATGVTSQTGWALAVVEVVGTVPTGVNGVTALKQNVNSNVNVATNIVATFAALGKRTLCIGLVGGNLNATALAAEPGWTKLTDIAFNTPATELAIVYQAKNADTTCTVTNASAWSGCIVGVEMVQAGNYP